MTNQELLNEVLREKQIEKEALKLSEGYRKVREPDIQQLIARHQREINKLEAMKINPEIELAKKAKLRVAVLKHKAEKKKQIAAVNVRFEQNDLNRTKLKGAV